VKRSLSLGGGVQSTALYRMAEIGFIPPIDVAHFVNHKADPQSTLDNVAQLQRECRTPVQILDGGDLQGEIMKRVRREKNVSGGPPFFTAGQGMLPRQCTRDHKLVPLERAHRRMIGLAKGQRAPKEILLECLIGFSYDEVMRMKPARLPFVRNVYPLIEMKMTRWHCIEWLKDHGFPVPQRSACIFCPYRSDREWLALKEQEPTEFAKAVAVDNSIRSGYVNSSRELFVHDSRKPLDSIDLESQRNQVDAFTNDCEGGCGT
jgi:hypothetical protein